VKGLPPLEAVRVQLQWLGTVSNDPAFHARLKRLGRDARQGTLAFLLAETVMHEQLETTSLVSDLLFGVIHGNERVQGGLCEGYIRSRAARCGFDRDPHVLAAFRSSVTSIVIGYINRTVVAPNLKAKPSALELATSADPPFVALDFFRVLKSATSDTIKAFIRAEKRREQNLDQVAPEGPEGSGLKDLEAVLQRVDVRAAVERLPPKLRRAVELHFFEGLRISSSDKSEETVQKKMGVTARSVGTYLAAAYEILRRTLDYP
jgi:hypothetical protein